MASISLLDATGVARNVATQSVNRDSSTEYMELTITADPTTALGVSVMAPGASGASGALTIQGVASGVPIPVSGVLSSTQAAGVGELLAVPTTGTLTTPVAIGSPPTGATRIEFYLQFPGAPQVPDQVQFTVATTLALAQAKTQAATPIVITYSGANAQNPPPVWLTGGQQVWVSATQGSPLYRWV